MNSTSNVNHLRDGETELVDLKCEECDRHWHAPLTRVGMRLKPNICPPCFNGKGSVVSEYTDIFKYGKKPVSGPTTPDFPITELRIVKMWTCHKGADGTYECNPNPSQHLMHVSQVDTFVKACVDLHHVRGNIHAGVQLNNLWELRSHKVNTETKGYWWCSPLQQANDPNRARLNDTDTSERLWAHPDLLAEERRMEDLD